MYQELAHKRNWQKAILTGLTIDVSPLTAEEKTIVSQIFFLRKILLENWDDNSKQLGLKVKRWKAEYKMPDGTVETEIINKTRKKLIKDFKDIKFSVIT